MSAQWAPYNVSEVSSILCCSNIIQAEYQWLNATDNYNIYDPQVTILNPYKGGMYDDQKPFG